MMPIFKKWININDRDMSTRSKGYIVKKTGSRATESRKQKMDYRDSKTEAVLEEE